MFKKILSPVLMSLTLTGFSGASFGDDWPDDIRNAGPAIDLLNESISYTGNVDFYSGYEDKDGVVSYLNPTNSSVTYTQYRHKIEGVIESPEDVDIIPVKIPHDLYMAFGAKVTSNQRDVVVNLLPANMLYSPLENGRGIYRDYGDEKEFTKHYTDITGSVDSRYFYDEGTIYYDGRMHPSITKEMLSDSYFYSDFIYAERSTTGGVFDFQKNRYKDDLYYYVINLKDRGEEFRGPISYILYQDFTDVPFESPQVATPYAENFESKNYEYIIAKSNYLNDDEAMIRYFKNNPEMQSVKVYPDILGYYKPKVYFNGDYNNPKSFLDIDWSSENGFDELNDLYARDPNASKSCENGQSNCFEIACAYNSNSYNNYTRSGHLSRYRHPEARYPNPYPRETALRMLSACLDPIKDAKNNASIIRAETDRKVREGYLSNNFKTKFDNMLGYYNRFGLQVNTFEDAILINNTNALVDSDNLAGTKDAMEIRLFSLLGDRDPYVRESYNVDLRNERTGEVEKVTVFESTCEEWKDFYKAEPAVSSSCFTGIITKNKSTTFENNDNELSVLDGDKIFLKTEDLYENDLYPSYTKVLKDSMTFTMKEMPELARFVDLPSSKSFEETVTLKIVDGNENKDTTEKDSIEVEVKVRNRFGGITEDFSVVLEETGVNTGIFRKDIQSVLVSSSADIISDDEVFQFVGTDSEYSIEFRHTDQKSFFINEEFSIDNASSFFELGQIYQDEFEDADLSRVISFEMDVLKNEDATINFYSSNNFELNRSYTLSLRDCNLYRQVESPEITFRNKTSGESYSFPLEQTSWNQCQYRTPSFYAYETEFKSVNLPTSENMFADINDEIVIEFLDPKGSNEQETLITSEFSVSGIYGSNASMLLGPEGSKQYSSASSIDNVYLMGGENKTLIAIRDNDRRILGEAGLALDVEIVNETKNSVYEFSLPLEEPSCPDCNSNTFSSEIEFSSIENEGDVFAENGDVIVFKYLDAGRSRDNESNVLISESFTILDATKTEIQIDEPVVLGKSNEIVISDQDLSAWRDLLSYNEMRDKEVIKVTNTTNNESKTIGMNSFYSNESNGYLRLEKDIGQEYAKESNLLANIGDVLRFEFIDFFGEDGLNSVVIKEAVVEEGDFDDASIYTSDIMYQEDFTLYVEHMAANKDSGAIDTVDVELYMSDGYNGEYLNEKETLTLTETDVDSGVFELLVDPVYTNNATQENGVVELSVWANNSVDYLKRVTFVYEKETTGFRLTYDNYINFEINGVFVQLDPSEDIKMKENLEVQVFNPLTTRSSINVEIVVTLLNGESWRFTKRLEETEEGVYSDDFQLKEVSVPEFFSSPEEMFECNDMAQVGSVGNKDISSSQFDFQEESIICSKDGAKIEVFYDYGELYSSEISIKGVIPDPIMTVTENLKVNDTAFVEVVDAAGNVSVDSVDTVYGYVLVRKANSELVDFESVENSFNIELESFELKETDIDTGVFVAEVPLSLRNKNSEAIYDNKELEVRSTVHDREFLVFAYNGLDPYGSISDGPIIIPTASGSENNLNSQSASVEDLVEDENIYSFDGDYSSVTPFEFRDIDGGYNGTLSLEKDYVDVNSTQRVKVFDMDLVKSGKTVTTVTLSNERSGFEKDFTLTLNPLTGYHSAIIEFVDENDFESQDGFRVQPNDIIEVKYLDEKREDNSEKEIIDQFEMLSGADAFLNASQRIFVKDTVSILLKDSDIIEQETAVVTVLNQRTNETESVVLNVDEENNVFLGSLNITYGDEITEEGVMGVNAEDNLVFIYVDEENSSDAPRDITIQRTVFSGTTGVLSMPRFVYIEDGINQVIDVLLTDYDLNNSVDERESVDVTIENIDTGESKVITLTEDGVNSSSFLGSLYFDENFTISDKDELRGSYLDEMTETGETVDVEAFSEIIGSEGSFSGILNVPEEIDIGETMTLSVTDSDNNNNSTEKESLTVVVKNTRSEVEKVIELFETDVDTGVFTGVLETSLESSELEEAIMGVIKNDVLQTEYFDEANVDGNPIVVNKSTLVISGFDAEMTVAAPVKVNQTVGVSVKDADENKDASVVEDIVVTVINQRTNQEVQLKMTETGVDTGRFSSGLETEYSEEPLEGDIMGVVANDEIVFSYTDKLTSKGKEAVISETRTLLGGFDAVLEVEENVFVGKPVEVKVVDEDENELSSEIETVTVNIRNERTNQIISIELIETSTDSGVFVGDFDTEYNEEITQENVISVINDDQVVVSYEDQFNSDGGTTTIEEIVTFIAGFDGEISVTSPNEIGNAMIVTVRDRDLDISSGVDTVTVVVMNERTKESIEVLLTEQVSQSRERTKTVAANDSNPFVGMVYGVNDMVGSGKGSELETFSGDYLVASYVDELNSQGQSETLTAKGLFLGADAIVLDKNSLEDSAVVGGLVPYTVEIENVSPNDLTNVEIIDNLPAGFRLAKDFVYVGDDKEPVSANGGVMTVTLDEIESNETIILTYVLKVGSGVVEGAYENKVKPYIGNILVGNEARATVYIQDDPLFNDALVFGKVFNDVNGNGYLDNGEEGIPGVTIAGVDGINVVTDSKGRYSIEGIDGGRMDRGVNYILKVMPETLPEGSEFTTENPRVQRITQGMPSKFNFGVAVPKQGAYTAMVEVRLGEVFFDWDKDNVKEEYESSLNRIANFIEEQGGGIVIIEGNTDSLGTDEYNEDLALRRASAVYKVLKEYLSDEVYQNIEVKIIK